MKRMWERLVRLKGEGKLYPVVMNGAIGVFALLGVLLACVFAVRDGYCAWPRRMLYFTQQSNVWIALASIAFAWVLIRVGENERILKITGMFKYIFTVSITVTGLVFCGLLAPFANVPVWYLSNVLTHVIVPVLAIVDFFTDKWILSLRRKYALCALIPLAAWFAFASVLCVLRVDFGKGEAYPYFFMDFYSEAGLFGIYLEGELPLIGSFYWFLFLLLLACGLCYAFYAVHAVIRRRREGRASSKA